MTRVAYEATGCETSLGGLRVVRVLLLPRPSIGHRAGREACLFLP